VPLLAASCPSTTGQSSTPTPRLAASSSIRRQVSGAQELAMQMTQPGRRRSSSPDCATTSSTWRSLATMTITISA
jgi:hypothetical protein